MKLSNIKPNIVVVGSSSIDLVLNTSKIPTANNTVLAESLQSFLGGKGANQAIATSRLGAQTYFISRVGMDPFGQQVLRNLNDEAVNVAYVVEDEDEGTGTAYVTASNEGNAITVVPAANYNLSPKDISEAEKYLVAADLILTQLEIPMQTVEFLFKKAEILNKKIALALENNLTPIYCCGEPLEVREAGEQNQFVINQLQETIFNLSVEDFKKLIIAYEPIWAIGTGKTATTQQAQEIHKVIRDAIAAKFGQAVADGVSILYGGSCNAQNAKELFANPDVDGGLIGGASLKAADFNAIVSAF